jgi:hypothetical protein
MAFLVQLASRERHRTDGKSPRSTVDAASIVILEGILLAGEA